MLDCRRTIWILICPPALLLLLAVGPDQSPSRAPAGSGSKTWVGRYQEVEEYLRTAECIRMEEVVPGAAVRRCVLRPGGPVSRMAWKPLPPGTYRGFRESYKADIAAYELDRLLGMDMVPPAVERELAGQRGAAIFWVENVTDMASSSRQGVSPGPPDQARWESQEVRMRMFDDLIGNHDRNAANVLHDAGWNLILIDHSRAFGSDVDLPSRLSGIDRDLWARIARLTRQEFEAALGPWLGDDQIDAMLSRREKMRHEVASLSK